MFRITQITWRCSRVSASVMRFSTSTSRFRFKSVKHYRQGSPTGVSKRIMTPEDLFKQASNVDVNNLKKEYDERKQVRYAKPNQKWLERIASKQDLPDDFNYRDTESNRSLVESLLVKKFGAARKNTNLKDIYFSEIDIGDVVDLSDTLAKNDLAVVVQLPSSPEDTRYTLINQYGEVEFVSRFRMGMKLPRIFPKEWFEGCVMNESQFLQNLNLAPIGKPKYKIEDDVERSRMFDSVIARASVAANIDVQCFILPSILSGIVSGILTGIINSAWNHLPEINLKLEVLHNVLQCTESPIHLGFYQLFKAVIQTDLSMLVKGLTSRNVEDVNTTYKKLLFKLSRDLSVENQFDCISLGRSVYGKVSLNEPIDINVFYGFVLGLRKNNQIFQFDSFANASSFITVVPLSRIVQFNRMVRWFKQNEENYEVMSLYIMKKIDVTSDLHIDKPEFYDDFVRLLKLYVAASFDDGMLESFVIKIIRGLPVYKDIDITRTVVYELLLKLGEISNSEDPFKWWYNSMIPGSGVSAKADLEESYYDNMNASNLNKFIDVNNDMVKHRKQYEDDIIYCIDSKNPLEIDDGISIKPVNAKEFIVSSFIANPSSYINPRSTIARIAFERGLTLYLPSINRAKSLSMLPKVFGESVQLGTPGKVTRVVKISFKVNVETGEVTYLGNDTINFATASKFVKVDYDSVNEILGNTFQANKILFDLSQATDVDEKSLKNDLTQLYKVSSKLKATAKEQGRSNVFDYFNVRREIENITTDQDNQIQMKFKELEDVDSQNRISGKSEMLVSEIMVMSNHVAGRYFVKNKIPAIFKIQNKLPKSKQVDTMLTQLVSEDETITFRDVVLLQQYMTKSTIAPFSSRHESLSMEEYANVTSPLRRFWDMVNHWQLQSFVENGKPLFTASEINYISLILMFKDELNGQISKRVIAFYTFKVLKQMQAQRGGESIKFKCIVTKKPSEDGLIEVILLDYGVRSILQTSWYALSDRTAKMEKRTALLKDIEIGDVIEDAEIEDIDLLEGLIVLRSGSY
ncbi:hypothetical protein FOA43_002741 [Brettanomyces nanus]|uniref:RNB domain-containing protein n=1 Tax=Eeniella nana TaxID=13502 RepID=A0A875RVA4_EENNA|nr:uncharacterized protein FOA43_002741 [Brettanomyces nanus]QPG75387.1 hypothetical protein FOA43_002741 [Brettanomyces nanus]